MSKFCYREKRFKADAQQVIEQANRIVERYSAQGLRLTLRQLSSSTTSS